MVIFLSAVAIFCTLFQLGYSQESHIYPATSSNGQHGIYPYWPFQAQTADRNYNPNHRRVRKPCSRRMNSNDPTSEDTESQWIPTYTSRIVKPLEENNLIFNSRSLKDKDFNSKPMVVSNKVVELNAVTEPPLSKNVNEPVKNNNPCEKTTTTAKDADSRSDLDYKQVEPNYYAEAEDKTGRNQYEYDSAIDVSTEINLDDCNNKIVPDGNSRRFLTQPDQVLSRPNLPVLNSNRTESVQEPKLNQKNVPPYSQDIEEPVESRVGFTNPRPISIEGNVIDPTKGRGISPMTNDKVMLMQNTKICYACSSVSDPTCWHPDRRTTVKYCRIGHDSCVTKTIRNTNGLIVIRDCARSCDDNDVTGLISRYKSCSICHYDLCNSAYSIKIHNVMLLSSLLAFIKYLL
ncbi:uncharacterized protein LOC115455862 [Manduca sexta]|nr:uncharacterized protein LOC115455862 [Manduca sexta]